MTRLGKKVRLVKSIDVDKIHIERYLFSTNALVIELPLDSQPDYVWQTFFEQEWRSSLHLWERKITVVGDRLLLITTPSEIEEKIDWLRNVIESTNMRVDKFVQTQKAVEETKASSELKRKRIVIRDVLRRKLSLV